MRRLLVGVLAAAAALALATPAATAQDGPDVRIRQATFDRDGATRLVVSVDGLPADGGSLDTDAFAVTDAGRAVADARVEPLVDGGQGADATVVVALDVSRSTRGEAIAGAKAAAATFVERLAEAGAAVGVVAFGQTADVVAAPDRSTADALTAIAALEASGGTALYDGVLAAVDLLGGDAAARDIVVFSDGADTASQASLADAAAAAEDGGVSVSAVALQTPDLDPAALQDLAERTGGDVLPVADAAALAASFERLAGDLTSRYVVTYAVPPSGRDEADIAVAVTAAGQTGRDAVVVLDSRRAAGELAASGAAAPPIPAFADAAGLYLGVGAAFVAVLVLLTAFVVAPMETSGSKVLRRSLKVTAGARKASAEEGGSALARAANMFERLPLNQDRQGALQTRLEQAAWPLRASEFRVMQSAGLLAGAGVGAVLFTSLPGIVVGGAVGAILPMAVLSRRISRRARDFEAQLPDMLQLLAGSLRAGYGLLQAVDTVAREADDPAAGELSRVLTEARLGGSVEAALEAMAERIGSEDFRWVVIAINIQRQVGGNLASLLETVAATIRERGELRREVKTLSAEGRLSAVILVALPFLIALYTAIVNPGYLAVLTGSGGGRIAIGVAGLMMVLGVTWMRKVIRIEV